MRISFSDAGVSGFDIFTSACSGSGLSLFDLALPRVTSCNSLRHELHAEHSYGRVLMYRH